MKLAFIADIHANFHYLELVAKQISREKPDIVYCLGDLVAYYNAPGSVIDWCKSNNVQAIKGNHEKYLLQELTPNEDRRLLYKTDEHRTLISEEQRRYLESLPDTIEAEHCGKKFFLTHSLPGDCETYLSNPDQLDRNFLRQYDYYCFGHSHHPWFKYHFGTLLLNPGSVGQPRDYSTKPSYAIVDLLEDTVSLHKVTVDASAYSRELTREGTDESMRAILTRTKEMK